MHKNKTIAYIGLGSNQGDSLDTLVKALALINQLPRTSLTAQSGVYRTEPQEDRHQPWFYNQAASITTGMEPLALLRGLQKIEARLGRERDSGRRFGPRSLDLDLLMYGTVKIDLPELQIPHPRMFQRAFVLVPLAEIAPEPLHGDILAALGGMDYVLNNDKIFQNH